MKAAFLKQYQDLVVPLCNTLRTGFYRKRSIFLGHLLRITSFNHEARRVYCSLELLPISLPRTYPNFTSNSLKTLKTY